VDLRDREGITQVVFNPEVDKAVHAKAHSIRNEYVLAVRGRVDPRPDGMSTRICIPEKSRYWSASLKF
jgi:aspartyl-tRNA synthetase